VLRHRGHAHLAPKFFGQLLRIQAEHPGISLHEARAVGRRGQVRIFAFLDRQQVARRNARAGRDLIERDLLLLALRLQPFAHPEAERVIPVADLIAHQSPQTSCTS
jgi:hypothetical protein